MAKARLGLQQLQTLQDLKMPGPIEEGLIDAALRAVVEVPRRAISRSGEDVELVIATDPDIVGEGPVSSEEQKGEEREGNGQEGENIL